MKVLRYILFPVSVVYWLVTLLRNYLFDKKVFKEFSFDVPVVNVGNLTVGGTGKTPFVEYLIRLYKGKKKVAVLSRGYGRNTKGFFLADDKVNATTIGDEPMQYFRKYGEEITVAVGEDRVQSVPGIFAEREDTELIILDDAYQHRYIKPSFNILLTKYQRLFFKDFVMPTGNLRESRKGARRADVTIVTKTPSDISLDEKIQIENTLKSYTKNKPVFFTTVKYGTPVPVFNSSHHIKQEIFLFSGLANDNELVEYVNKHYKLKAVERYPDHYKYTEHTINKLLKRYHEEADGAMLLTTEKDMVKLLPFEKSFEGLSLFYLPIEIEFLDREDEFIKLINQTVD